MFNPRVKCFLSVQVLKVAQTIEHCGYVLFFYYEQQTHVSMEQELRI